MKTENTKEDQNAVSGYPLLCDVGAHNIVSPDYEKLTAFVHEINELYKNVDDKKIVDNFLLQIMTVYVKIDSGVAFMEP